MKMYFHLLTGLIAGIASSVLYVSGTVGTSLSLFLYFLAPLPLFITGLGWGAASAAAGALAGVIVCTIIAGLPGGLIYLISIGAIPVVLSYYALMSRELDDDKNQSLPKHSRARDWYPLGHLIVWIAGFAAVLTAVFILFIMPSTSELKNSLEILFGAILDQNPELKVRLGGESAVQQMVTLFIAVMPATLAAYTFTTTTVNFWLASKVITASGRAIRPALEINTLSYPKILPLALVAAFVLTFLPGIVHTIALAATASLIMAFMFLGLIVIHAIVPQVPARAVFLGMFYLTLFILLKYAYMGLALVGITETIFGIRQRFLSSRPPNSSGTPPAPRGD